jgi:hypothetical protein
MKKTNPWQKMPKLSVGTNVHRDAVVSAEMPPLTRPDDVHRYALAMRRVLRASIRWSQQFLKGAPEFDSAVDEARMTEVDEAVESLMRIGIGIAKRAERGDLYVVSLSGERGKGPWWRYSFGHPVAAEKLAQATTTDRASAHDCAAWRRSTGYPNAKAFRLRKVSR